MQEKKILLVEDDVFLKDIYHEILTTAGFIVVIATTFDEIKQAVKKDIFDLCLIDYYLPDMNGVEILNQLKTISPPPVKKFVFLTNVSDENDLKKIEDAKCESITKSEITPQELVIKVKEILKDSL